MSKIKLYRNCKILEEKNYQVENIADYLATFSGGDTKVFDNAQYIKNGLDTEVKVVLDQTYLDKQWTNVYNYCSIEMDNGGLDNTYYYFIREMKWISKNCIKLVLRLDVLNTYNGQYELTDKTTIIREHKDRFVHDEDYNYSIQTKLDNDDWSWNITPATSTEKVGRATFILPNEFRGRKIKTTYTLVSGTNADFYSEIFDNETCELTIEAHKLGYPRPRIPDGNIIIYVETILSNKLIRKIDEQSEGFDNVLWNQNQDELLEEVVKDPTIRYDSSDPEKDKIHMGESSWYITYKAKNEYSSSDPDKFIYDNGINTFITTDKSGLKVPASADTEIRIADLFNNISEENWSHGVVACFPVGASGKHMPNSFTEFDESYLSSEPKTISIDIVDGDGEIMESYKIYTEYVSWNNHSRLKQHCLVLQEDGLGGKKMHVVQLKRDNFYTNDAYKLSANLNQYYPNGKLIFRNISEVKFFTTTSLVKPQGNIDNYYDAYIRNPGSPVSYAFSGGSVDPETIKELKNFNLTNRSDQRLVKIINVPYAPVDILYSQLIYDNNEEQLSLNQTGYKYDAAFTHQLKLNILPESDIEPYSPLTDILVATPQFNQNTLRNDLYESKLYHSDFYQVKCVYDSFGYVFRNELLNTDFINYLSRDDYEKLTNNSLYVDYCVSNSVSSAFGINFVYSYPLKKGYQDYNSMVVNRNLEMPIYNNYYLNYLRSGALNADKKANQARDIASGIGTGVGIASTVAGIALSATGYGATFGAPMIVGGIASTATSLTSAITNSVQSDRALQQKLDQAKQQSASVSGSDDIGLLKWYGNQNHCKLVKYDLSENTKKRIADLFYYCGYRCDYQEVPDTNSRYWFNFVQCEPVFDENRYTAKMGKEQKDELANKYKQGITVLHEHDLTWDFEQIHENFETWLK